MVGAITKGLQYNTELHYAGQKVYIDAIYAETVFISSLDGTVNSFPLTLILDFDERMNFAKITEECVAFIGKIAKCIDEFYQEVQKLKEENSKFITNIRGSLITAQRETKNRFNRLVKNEPWRVTSNDSVGTIRKDLATVNGFEKQWLAKLNAPLEIYADFGRKETHVGKIIEFCRINYSYPSEIDPKLRNISDIGYLDTLMRVMASSETREDAIQATLFSLIPLEKIGYTHTALCVGWVLFGFVYIPAFITENERKLILGNIADTTEALYFANMASSVMKRVVIDGSGLFDALARAFGDYYGIAKKYHKQIAVYNSASTDQPYKIAIPERYSFRTREFSEYLKDGKSLNIEFITRFEKKLLAVGDDATSIALRYTKKAREAAVSAIAAQSLSHNIGSHALSDPDLFNMEKREDMHALRHFHKYLQGRLDYTAQLLTHGGAQAEPMYLWQDVLFDFFRQRLLLNCLISDRGFSGEGGNIKFRIIKVIKDNAPIEVDVPWEAIKSLTNKDNGDLQAQEKDIHEELKKLCSNDVLVSIPGGGVGRHALYTIIENIMRNSAKYGKTAYGEKDPQKIEMIITLHLREGEIEVKGCKTKFWKLKISDNMSGFDAKTINQYYAKDEDGTVKGMVGNFERSVIESDHGSPALSGSGLVEIRESMKFLHHYEDSDVEDDLDPQRGRLPYAYRNDGDERKRSMASLSLERVNAEFEKLVYRVRLAMPCMLEIWNPGAEGGIPLDRYHTSESVWIRYRAGDFPYKARGDEAVPGEVNPYFFIINDDGVIDVAETCGKIAAHHWEMPYRVLLVTNRKGAWETAMLKPECKMRFEYKTIDDTPDERKKYNDEVITPAIKGLPKRRIRLTDDAVLHCRLMEYCANPDFGDSDDPRKAMSFAFVNFVYDCWLRAYKPNKPHAPGDKVHRPWNLAICFERSATHAATMWDVGRVNYFNECNYTEITPRDMLPPPDDPDAGRKPWAYCFVFSQEPGEVEQQKQQLPDSKPDFDSDNQAPDSHWIQFENHSAKVTEPSGAKLRFNQSFGKKEALRTFLSLSLAPEGRETFRFYVYRILEAALTNIIVFDERLTKALLVPAKPDSQGRQPWYQNEFSDARLLEAWNAGVWPLVAIPSGLKRNELVRVMRGFPIFSGHFKDEGAHDKKLMEMGGRLIFATVPASINGVTFLSCPVMPDGQYKFILWNSDFTEKEAADYLDEFEEKIPEADMFIFHEGLCDEHVKKNDLIRGMDLLLLQFAPHVVRVSGRGRTKRSLHSGHPFLEYSAIARCILPYEGISPGNKRKEQKLIRQLKEESDPLQKQELENKLKELMGPRLKIEKIMLASALLNIKGTNGDDKITQ